MTRWRRLVAWLGAPEAGTSVALVRVLLGACVLHTMLLALGAGVIDVIWLSTGDGGYRDLGDGSTLVRWLGGPSPTVVYGLVWTVVGASTLLLLGVGGPVVARGIALVTLQAFMGVSDLNAHAGGSYDELIANGLWLLVLAGPSRTLSVEARLATGRWWTPERAVPRWPRLLLAYQVVLMYATTGWQKLSVHWVPGGDLSALYYILLQPTWQLRDNRWVAQVFPATQVGTLVSWLWEVTAPVWLVALLLSWDGRALAGWRRWVAASRWGYLAIGVVFHVLVTSFMNIGPFSWASLAFYPALVHPAEWGRVVARWRRAGSSVRRSPRGDAG